MLFLLFFYTLLRASKGDSCPRHCCWYGFSRDPNASLPPTPSKFYRPDYFRASLDAIEYGLRKIQKGLHSSGYHQNYCNNLVTSEHKALFSADSTAKTFEKFAKNIEIPVATVRCFVSLYETSFGLSYGDHSSIYDFTRHILNSIYENSQPSDRFVCKCKPAEKRKLTKSEFWCLAEKMRKYLARTAAAFQKMHG